MPGRGGMLGDAVGHAVEGQFIMDVGAEGHGSPLSTMKGIYSFLTTKAQRHEERENFVSWCLGGSFFHHEDKKARRGRKFCVLPFLRL
jgi:hypothetical protein